MTQHKAETEDKGKIAQRKEAKEDAQPQHDEGHFTASLDLGQLNTNTVGHLQRTIGNKATREIIQRQYPQEDKFGKVPASPGGPIPMPYPNIPSIDGGDKGMSGVVGKSKFKKSFGDEPGTLKGMISNTNMDKAASPYAPGMDPVHQPLEFAANKLKSEQGGKVDQGDEGFEGGKFSGGGSQTGKLGDYENKFEG